MKIKLHCPECWKSVDISEGRRIHHCTNCNELSYHNPEGSSQFLQTLKSKNSYHVRIKQLAGQEELIIQEMLGHQESERKISANYLEVKKKGKSTRRVVALTIMILALTGFILFFDMQSVRSSFIPVFILGTLLGLSLLLLIVQKTGASIEKNKLVSWGKILKGKTQELLEIQQQMDKLVVNKFGQLSVPVAAMADVEKKVD